MPSSCGPNESVTPASNQQIIPALQPASTTPASHASRRIRSKPCRRQTASMFAVLPPQTRIDVRPERELAQIVRRPRIERELGQVAGEAERVAVLRARRPVDEHAPAAGLAQYVLEHRLVRETADAHDRSLVHRRGYDNICAHDTVRIRLRRAVRRRPGASRRQGNRTRRDDPAGNPGARRLHDHDRRLPRVHARRRHPRGARPGDRRADRTARGEGRQAVRRLRRPAARVRALRRRDLDAGDDGHDPQRRHERRRGARSRASDRQPGVRVRLLPASDPDVRRDRGRDRAGHLQGRPVQSRADGRDVQDRLPPRDGRGLPAGRARAAPPRGRRRLRVVEHPSGATCTGRRTASRTTSGTAVNVVQMVFGNKGESSATGVCFTRNPSTGEQGVYGEYLVNAQGEDVVAGIRTPQPVEEMEKRLPDAYAQLARDDGAPGAALPRHAGHRVHRRGGARCTSCRRAPRSARPPRRSRPRSTWRARG